MQRCIGKAYYSGIFQCIQPTCKFYRNYSKTHNELRPSSVVCDVMYCS